MLFAYFLCEQNHILVYEYIICVFLRQLKSGSWVGSTDILMHASDLQLIYVNRTGVMGKKESVDDDSMYVCNNVLKHQCYPNIIYKPKLTLLN